MFISSVFSHRLLGIKQKNYNNLFISVKETRRFTQFHYVNWPDHDVPSSFDSILDMIGLMREYQEHDDVPICVHCRYDTSKNTTDLHLAPLLRPVGLTLIGNRHRAERSQSGEDDMEMSRAWEMNWTPCMPAGFCQETARMRNRWPALLGVF